MKTKKKIKKEELRSLDVTIARFVHPRLKKFKKLYAGRGIPGKISRNSEWVAILQKMIDAFAIVASECVNPDKEQRVVIDEGLKLFAEHFTSLWD